ncbi:MAG: hypothetical protein K2Y18_02265 [Alphaproteobacteria bacterium]|jgi:hypothetical protein|nr:hypothetical protein [Alphaproteobacteria bacterium]
MKFISKIVFISLLVLGQGSGYGTETVLRYNNTFMYPKRYLVDQRVSDDDKSVTVQEWIDGLHEDDLSSATVVDLSRNQIGDKGAKILVEWILEHLNRVKEFGLSSHFRELNLSHNPISEKVSAVFVPLLLHPKFERLVLKGTNAGCLDGQIAIREALKAKIPELPAGLCYYLMESRESIVDRFCNKIVLSSGRAFESHESVYPSVIITQYCSEAIQKVRGSGIDKRYLVDKRVSDDDKSVTVQEWIDGLHEDDLSSFTGIDLSENRIGDEGAKILVQWILEHLNRLEEFGLSRHFKELNLSSNPLSSNAGTIFAPLLLHPKFEHLVLVRTDAGSLDGREDIREALRAIIPELPPELAFYVSEDRESVVERFCNKIIYLPKGRLEFLKSSTRASVFKRHVDYYHSHL